MKHNHLKTGHDYHDTVITAVDWTKVDELRLTIDLNGNGHNRYGPCLPAWLYFSQVKNRPEIEATFAEIDRLRTHNRWIASINGVSRDSSTTFCISASPASIRIHALSFYEA